jgi:hypothetical protein
MDSITREQNAQMGNGPEQSPYWTPHPELTPEQMAERSFDLYRLYQISQVRESALPQFDGMGYSRYNETNEMADMSFLPPKKNKGDSRITTGITHEKDASLVSFFLNLNFEGNVRVFKGDKEEYELGTAITKLVRKSREQEFYNDKRGVNYKNYVVQGTAFTCEEYREIWVPDKQLITDPDPTALDKVKWIDKGLKKITAGCVSNLVDGKKVFLENIREPDIQKQPGVYTVEYVPREIMKGIWGKTEMWKYVPYMINPSATSLGTLSQASIYSDWVFGEIDFNKCEVIKVYRPFEQRYQIYINGVPMLKVKYPLKAISPSGLVPLAKGDIDLMNLFAYSKSEPAKTKIDQAVFDEVLQNMIIKSRQSAFVPRVNNSDKILSPDMFLGGKMISNVDVDMIKPLIDNPGITASDFSFYQLFKEQIDSKTISSMMEGYAPDTGGMSLGQYMDMQKKQMMKIGGKIDGIINWEKQMLRLRVMNILAHPAVQDENGEYKDITLTDTMSDGTQGLNVMKFANPNPMTSQDVLNQENDYKNQTGQQVEITYLNPELMKQILEDDDYYLCYEVVPVDKNNDKLTQMMFVSMITQAAQLFGMESLQVENLKKQYASVMGRSFDDLFISSQDLQAKQLAMQNNPANTNKPAPAPMDPKMLEAVNHM